MAESAPGNASVTVKRLPVSDTVNPTSPRSPTRSTETSLRPEPNLKDSKLSSLATAGLTSSIHAKTSKRNLPSDFDPPPLTAAAALADERRQRIEEAKVKATKTSPNLARSTMNVLLGRSPVSSRLSDAPSSQASMTPAPTIITNSTPVAEPAPIAAMQTSPTSISSQDAGSLTIAGHGPTVESPIAMDPPNGLRGSDQERSHKAVTYPPPPSSDQQELRLVPPRGMSLPDSGYRQDIQRSNSSTKKHKCPYCDTDFTRHHNLKSHLLTHSQEKPFVCQTCNARFRRLHDLKRHTKLHTGERSHICNKCGRKFARGDALARHNKGQAGCAGQRMSLGGDDEYGEGTSGMDDMDDVSYQDDQNEHGNGYARRRSEPGSKAMRSLGSRLDASSPATYRTSTTYPGSAVTQAVKRAMQPPNVTNASAGLSPRSNEQLLSPRPAGTSGASSYMNAGGPSVYAQNNMTESPLPLSPGQPGQSDSQRISAEGSSFPPRRKSPPRQQSHRLPSYGASPTILPPLSLTQPLPPLTNLAPDQRQIAPLQSPTSNGRGSYASGAIAPVSGGSSSHHSSGSSLREHLGGASSANELWDHVRRLEGRLTQVQDEMASSLQKQQNQYEQQIRKLQDELDTMKNEKDKHGGG